MKTEKRELEWACSDLAIALPVVHSRKRQHKHSLLSYLVKKDGH
jgi:hypothetical protein